MKIEYFLGIGQGIWSERWLEHKIEVVNFHPAPNYLKGRMNTDRIEIGVSNFASLNQASEKYILIAESQAAPAAIETLLSNKIPLPQRLVLVQPLGLNYAALGKTPSQRRRELLHRSRLFWKHRNQSLSISGNRQTLLTLIRESLRNFSKLHAAYLFGANQNYSGKLGLLAEKIRVDVFASEQDSLFPYDEIAHENPTISVHKLPGTHLNRATPLGVKQIKDILNEVQ